LIEAGIDQLPCVGDGRQSGTSGSPSILNISPEAAAGGDIALIRSGDRLRIDLGKREMFLLVDAMELAERRQKLEDSGGYICPVSQTPWQALYRSTVGQLSCGAVMEGAVEYQQLAQVHGVPRHNH
jgi:dihydroxy-acid dehydratase